MYGKIVCMTQDYIVSVYLKLVSKIKCANDQWLLHHNYKYIKCESALEMYKVSQMSVSQISKMSTLFKVSKKSKEVEKYQVEVSVSP